MQQIFISFRKLAVFSFHADLILTELLTRKCDLTLKNKCYTNNKKNYIIRGLQFYIFQKMFKELLVSLNTVRL